MEKRPFYRKVRQTLHETVSDSGKSILCYRGNNDKIYYVASSDDANVEPGGGMIEVTWQELKNKRDAGELIPGSFYRITDYQCTTTQENTKSAGHQFDIVLLALSENKLAEESWAMHHANDTYFANSNLPAWKVWYCLDNDKSRFAWADDSVIGDIENIVVYYPEHTNLLEGTVPAHDAVYTLTNETQIVKGVTYFKLLKLEGNGNNELFVNTKNINTETTLYDIHSAFGTTSVNAITDGSIKSINYNTPPTEEGRGVIYRLIDEFNNDIKYDFKNIQFKRTITDGQYDENNGTETWCYTLNVWYNNMCQDASIVGNTLPNDESFVNGVYDNRFGYATAYDLYIEGVNTFAFALGNNVVLSVNPEEYYGIYSNTIGDGFYSNTIGEEFHSNTIGSFCKLNTIGNIFCYNIIGNDFQSNTIGAGFVNNSIGNIFSNNTTGDNVSTNMIGNNFVYKTISNNTNYKNYGSNGVELATK